MSIIDFSNVRFSYDGKRNALDGVTLAIEPGSFVCVLGGNGSGKSTLAKHINALLAPDEGRVLVIDHDTSEPENVFFVKTPTTRSLQASSKTMWRSALKTWVCQPTNCARA